MQLGKTMSPLSHMMVNSPIPYVECHCTMSKLPRTMEENKSNEWLNKTKNGLEWWSIYNYWVHVCAFIWDSDYAFVGHGWCLSSAGQDYVVNNYRRANQTDLSCRSQCDAEANCFGYAIADERNVMPGRCDIYVSAGTQAPLGWTESLHPYYDISFASGDTQVNCFMISNTGNFCTTQILQTREERFENFSNEILSPSNLNQGVSEFKLEMYLLSNYFLKFSLFWFRNSGLQTRCPQKSCHYDKKNFKPYNNFKISEIWSKTLLQKSEFKLFRWDLLIKSSKVSILFIKKTYCRRSQNVKKKHLSKEKIST